MISCPSCGKDIADDSLHCGYCGAEIATSGGKKTIMGFGAITGDVLRQAAEDAKKAREEAEGAAGVGDQPSESKLKIPKPAISSPSVGDTPSAPSLGKLSIPKIGGGVADSRDEAKTEVMEPVTADERPSASAPSAPATIEEKASAVVPPSVVVQSQEPSEETDWRTSQTDPPGAWSGPAKAEEESWSMGSAGAGVAEPTSPEAVTVPTSNPLQLGEPLPGGALAQGQQTLPAKKSSNNKLIIPLVAVFIIIGLCCITSVLYGLLAL